MVAAVQSLLLIVCEPLLHGCHGLLAVLDARPPLVFGFGHRDLHLVGQRPAGGRAVTVRNRVEVPLDRVDDGGPCGVPVGAPVGLLYNRDSAGGFSMLAVTPARRP